MDAAVIHQPEHFNYKIKTKSKKWKAPTKYTKGGNYGTDTCSQPDISDENKFDKKFKIRHQRR